MAGTTPIGGGSAVYDDDYGTRDLYTGDGGLATKAGLNTPTSLAFNAAGDLFIVDGDNYVVRRVDAVTGIISTVAGNHELGKKLQYSGNGGPAINAALNLAWGIAVDVAGNLFIADSGNGVIRKVAF